MDELLDLASWCAALAVGALVLRAILKKTEIFG